jgi:hypothetical protein
MRHGLQWLGRERLSQAHYHRALEHLGQGDVDKALWDAEMALHNYPRHIHAAKLREQLLSQREWLSEASSIRTYIMDRIAEENQIARPPFGRPAPPFVIPRGIDGPTGFEEDGDNEG